MDTVTVQGKVIPAPVTAKHKGKSAPAEENIGFVSGLAIGAGVAGGPIGAVAGAITGAVLGEHYHKQKVANHELAAGLFRQQRRKSTAESDRDAAGRLAGPCPRADGEYCLQDGRC